MSEVTQAVVLAGGRGERLGEMTRTIPKPMLPVGGRPFLEYVIAALRKNGIQRVLFCASYLAEVIASHFGTGEAFGVATQICVERSPLGTGGALRLAQEELDSLFLVLNGDTMFDFRLVALAELLAARPQALAAIALRGVPDAARYGRVRLEGELVCDFNEKGRPVPGLISGGVYCLRKEALALLPPGTSSLEQDLFPRLAVTRSLCGKEFDGYFIDIGIRETFELAQKEMPLRFAATQRGT